MISILPSSVADPFHFDTAPDPDPRIHFLEKRIRIRPKTDKDPNSFTCSKCKCVPVV